MRLFTFALAAGLLLAGCAAPEVTTETSGPVGQDVETGPEFGAISGVVVDDTISPIAGAEIELVNMDMQVTTGDDGLFIFEDLQPGFYVINATAPDFLPIQSTAQVDAGKTVKPRIVLPPDLTPKPYHYTTQFSGHMVISDIYGVYILTTEIGNNELCDCMFDFTSDPEPKMGILEAHWESSTPRADGHGMWWDFWPAAEGYAGSISDGYHESPMVWRIDLTPWKGETEWVAQASSGLQPDVEQDFEGFMTFFHVDKAPDGWSFIAGDR